MREVSYTSSLDNKGFTEDCIVNCILQICIDNRQKYSYNNRQVKHCGEIMQITITLKDQELQFLQNIQKLINSKTTSLENQCTLEDVIHECITIAISMGVSMQRGQA